MISCQSYLGFTYFLIFLGICVTSGAASATKLGSGVNLSGLEWGSALPGTLGTDYFSPTQAEIDYYMNRGLNIFRLPFKWERLQPTLSGALDSTYWGYITQLTDYAISRNAFVILDVHNYARYQGQIIGASGSNVTANDLADLWIRIGAKYGSNSQVIFGLMNEPNTMSTLLWWQVAQNVTNAIRSANINNLLLVPGNGWTGMASWTQNWYSNQDANPQPNSYYATNFVDPANNFLFDLHQYFDSNYSGTNYLCTATMSVVTGYESWANQSQPTRRSFVSEYAGSRDISCQNIVEEFAQHLLVSDLYAGWTWWAGGPEWGNVALGSMPPPYGFWLETQNLTGNVTQMGWIGPFLIQPTSTPTLSSSSTNQPTPSPALPRNSACTLSVQPQLLSLILIADRKSVV